ncbi:MAG: hypothetical protein FJ276_02740 [Planctomycetes bacterium]|nr:hypothetical protein [Planctomycetota bacterium]
MPLLDHDEYIEQAHLYRSLRERLPENMPLQELLAQLREELLSTTKLPMAVGFLLGELRHVGVMASAMQKLPHYFAAFQTYVIREAEKEPGRFDMRMALEILRFEAEYRAAGASPQGLFLYQFEALCRNRLRYEIGLDAITEDPMYDQDWREWIQTVRCQIGIIDFADMVYVRSQHYVNQRAARLGECEVEKPVLFGEKEGKIALANRRKDPLYLFSALQRHLGYPRVPRPKPIDQAPHQIPQLLRRVEQLETRLKLLEDEQRGGIDLTQFFGRADLPGDGPLLSD